ncbi:ataxin-7-like protein 1 isoform X2 [Lytechinus variegatus]|uniref:ataxin-7-like protein 1 isoform X2 n=1 Tax=Lytechinus variegatus TaxID=7654 RepID=UPI001BB2CAB3|nr:ataxin-7-like protein 1 isoform X2 [Lytechinus variegatus]
MASLERSSPSMFLGQSWSSWADKVTNQGDEDAENDEKSGRVGEEMEPEISREKEEPQVMRLKMEDSPMFGLCPGRDEFYLVVCEQCKQVVKPQALQRHIEFRHGKPPDGPLPPLPIPAPLGDTPSPTCNKQIMHAHWKTGRSVSRPPSRSNSHPLFVSLPQVADSPSPESDTQRTQSVPDLIAAVAKPSIDISPMRHLEDHLRQPHSTSPPPPHDPHLPSQGSPPSSNHDVLSAPSSPVDTVLLESPSLSGITSFSSLQTAELSQELSIQVPSQDESLIDRSVPSIDKNYAGDTVEVVLASPPVQNMPVPLTSVESLSTSLSTPQIISLPVADTLPQVQLPSEAPSLVQITHQSSSTYTPVKPRPVAITPTPPPAPSITPPTPKSSGKKKKVNAVKSDKNVPCKDRRYDPDKHCGVWSEEHKRHCTRSLTCKTHSLSLRRAVQGRRLPFNELLAEHKARSQALAAAKAAAAGGTTPAATATSATATVLSNNHSNSSGGSQPMLKSPSSSTSSKKEMLSPQNLGGTPTVPVLQGPGPTPVIINSSAHPLKRHLSVSTPPSSIHLMRDDSSPSSVVVVPLDTSQTPTPLRQQEHHPSPTHQRIPSQGVEGKEAGERLDSPCTHHHPRPFAMCTYGSKRTEQGMVVLNRRQDRLRAALAGLVERQLKPPPLKKVCHSQESAVVPNLAKNGSNITSVPPKLTNSHLDQGLLHSAAVPNAKPSKSSTSKSKKSKASRSDKSGDGSFSHQVKNSKVRRKSGSGASGGVSPAIIQTSSSSNLMHNIFTVSSSSNVPLAIAPATYTVVGGNGLQPVDMINVDNNTSVSDMQGQLLKNLRFVVTNIDNTNNAGGASQPAITLPILNAVGNAPMVIGNIGALQLHDGKMNIKSRTKNVGSKNLERQSSRTRKPSGSGIVHCSPQQTVQIGTVQGDTIIVQDQGVISSMRSSPSPVLRPESSSPQLTSLPNGIIPSPSGTALYTGNKVYGGSSAGNAVVGVGASGGVVMVDQHHPQLHQPHQPQHIHHHQQQQQQQQPQQQPPGDITSPSGTSTPSPGGNSTETSPSGSFQYSSGIQSISANKSFSTSNSSKSSGSRKQQQNTKSSGSSGAMSGGGVHTNQHQTTSVQPIPFQVPLQHIMANLIDAQGKSLSAIIPANHQLFSGIQLQQSGSGAPAATPGAPVMQSAVATVTPGDHQNKASSPPTAAAASLLAQQPIALSLPQQTSHHHHQAGNQSIRIQGTGLATVGSVGDHTPQAVLSPGGTGDPRQELKLHH